MVESTPATRSSNHNAAAADSKSASRKEVTAQQQKPLPSQLIQKQKKQQQQQQQQQQQHDFFLVVEDVLYILKESKYLQRQLPRCRQLVLIETIRSTQSKEQAKQIMIENLANSPYIPHEVKNILVDLILEENIPILCYILECPFPQEQPIAAAPVVATRGVTICRPKMCRAAGTLHLEWEEARDNNFLEQLQHQELASFREMIVSLFSHSRKMSSIQSESCRQIGTLVYLMSSKEDLLHFVIETLKDNCGVCQVSSTSSSSSLPFTNRFFSDHVIENIINDFLDQRYERLLLPNRFDCDELPRLGTCSLQEFEEGTAMRRSLRQQQQRRSFEKLTQRLSGYLCQSSPCLASSINHAATTQQPLTVSIGQRLQREEIATVVDAQVEENLSKERMEKEYENIEEEDEQPCPICFGSQVANVQTPCQHRMCHDCVSIWAGMTGDAHTFHCPICRYSIPISLLESNSTNN